MPGPISGDLHIFQRSRADLRCVQVGKRGQSCLVTKSDDFSRAARVHGDRTFPNVCLIDNGSSLHGSRRAIRQRLGSPRLSLGLPFKFQGIIGAAAHEKCRPSVPISDRQRWNEAVVRKAVVVAWTNSPTFTGSKRWSSPEAEVTWFLSGKG